MKILPFDTYQIQTSLTLKEVVDLMNQNVEPRKWFRFSLKHKPFEGDVSQEGFKIMRIIHYRNSFLPIILGEFVHNDMSTSINVKMRLHWFVALFMFVWFTGVIAAILVTSVALAFGKTDPSPFLLIPFAMLVFGWGMTTGGFWFEAKKSKKALSEILPVTTKKANQPIQPTAYGRG